MANQWVVLMTIGRNETKITKAVVEMGIWCRVQTSKVSRQAEKGYEARKAFTPMAGKADQDTSSNDCSEDS